jgi:UDP-2,3-diacylglucosamine hydrolase
MTVHFISDLHLCEQQPHLLRLFNHYLEQHAPAAEKLYILGDLFEVWIGDDYQPEWVLKIQQRLADLVEKGTQVYFCHGNRDFLVGEGFAAHTGVKLLDEYQVIQLGNRSALLCHGDTLCTDDAPYQEFRAKVRQREWQNQFLALSIEQRLAIVNDYRDQSKAATATKADEIMDVNSQTVQRTFDTFKVNLMIHGHTHRPAIHQMHNQQRIVLSDWRDYGQFLQWNDNVFQPVYFDLSGTCSR